MTTMSSVLFVYIFVSLNAFDHFADSTIPISYKDIKRKFQYIYFIFQKNEIGIFQLCFQFSVPRVSACDQQAVISGILIRTF